MAGADPAETVVTWRDLAGAARHRALRSRVWFLLVPLCLLAAGLVVVAETPLPRLIGVFLALYIATIPMWGPTVATWMQARNRSWPTSPTRWVAGESGLDVVSERGASTLPWTSVTDVTSWRGGVTLTCGRAAVVIPDRAFSGDAHREAFVTTVRASAASTPTG